MSAIFADRSEAGRQLARAVLALKPVNPVVLALPRGGVPVAIEVAHALRAPLDLLFVRKIGAPGDAELAIAAVVEGPELVIDRRSLALSGADEEYVEQRAIEELREIARRRALYLRGRPAAAIEGKTIVLVDDGIATGTSVRAALRALRRRRPARLILAVPVAPPDVVASLRDDVDALVCLSQPRDFLAVGNHYADFHQVEDDEVIRLLDSVEGGR